MCSTPPARLPQIDRGIRRRRFLHGLRLDVVSLLRFLSDVTKCLRRALSTWQPSYPRAALSNRTEGRAADFWMRERGGRQDVPERSGTNGLARLASGRSERHQRERRGGEIAGEVLE